eukprot:545098-Pleurochrysis_carterae.AAC.2
MHAFRSLTKREVHGCLHVSQRRSKSLVRSTRHRPTPKIVEHGFKGFSSSHKACSNAVLVLRQRRLETRLDGGMADARACFLKKSV